MECYLDVDIHLDLEKRDSYHIAVDFSMIVVQNVINVSTVYKQNIPSFACPKLINRNDKHD
jgi:HD superfamily phosphohydrolase